MRDGEALPALRSRVDTAAQQWHVAHRYGLRPFIFCLGGVGPHGDEAEAPVMATRLTELGVPRSVIIEEACSRTTEENLRNLHAILAAADFPDRWAGRPSSQVPDVSKLSTPDSAPSRPVLIVTSAFHLPRALLMARHLGFSARGVGAPAPRRDTLVSVPRELGALILWGVRSGRRHLPKSRRLRRSGRSGPGSST